MTGAHTRLVWVQGDGTDPFAAGDGLVLMGFDTEDGRGERVILGERQSYVKPLLTARGERIVFSTRPTAPDGPQVFVVNWDGSGKRRLGPGFALTVWQDPSKGRDWVYVGTDNAPGKEYDFRTVTRWPIDAPSAREVVWNKTPVSGDTFQVSSDGGLAGGLFPWPQAGVVELPNGRLRTFGEGCWTALRDAGTPLLWYFDGAHRNLLLVDPRSDERWTVRINDAPGFAGAEVYHPRWTNHPRFIVLSGPYNQGGTNQVRSGGRQSEVHLGRFSEDFSRVEAWVKVTSNGGGDSYPDVWIDRGGSPFTARRSAPSAAVRPGGGTTPTVEAQGTGRLVVDARLQSATPIPNPRAILPYRAALVVNAYEVVKVVEGQYSQPRLLVAQWAIRDGKVLGSATRDRATVVRLALERYDAHPELEGERLIAENDDPQMILFYDIRAQR